MIKYNLICKCGETFESWFSGASEFDTLRKRKLIKCIYCESTSIKKTVMAPNLSSKSNKMSAKTKLEKNIKNKFDVVLNMEVVEHVTNLNLFIQNCSKLTKKNGIMFIATINRNLKSYFFAILGAEYILRWLPIGTHDWNKFLTPQDLEIITNKNDFKVDDLVGMKFDIFSKKWSINKDTSVNYISTFLKN